MSIEWGIKSLQLYKFITAMYRVRKILSFFFFCQTVVWGTIRFATGEPAGVGHAVLPQSDTYLASVKQVAGGIF